MRLNFRLYGDGPPLLILHGLLGSLDNWATLAKKFGEQFKTYIIDQRNHGLSPHSDAMNFEVMADDLLELMEDEQIARAHLIGHSMGGKVAMRLAVLHPERLRKLVVVDIAPRAYPPAYDDVFRGLFAIKPESLSSREEADHVLAQHVHDLGMRQFLLKNLTRDEFGRFRWRMNLEGIYRSYDTINAATTPTEACPVETLFVRGSKSSYITDEDQRSILEAFPRAQFTTVEGAGHWVHAEKPDAFVELVLRFLTGVSP